MPSGGKRPGAGRPKGTLGTKTIEKHRELAAVREMVMARVGPMVEAQIQNSIGISHFFKHLANGKFERVTDPDEIQSLLNGEGEGSFHVFTKDPSVQAFADLMNRTFGKPEEAMSMDVSVNVDEVILARLVAGRKRASEA